MSKIQKLLKEGGKKRNDVSVRLGKIAAALVMTASVALTGCAAVGPEYVQPALDVPEQWNSLSADTQSENTQRLAAWWQVFDDPTLSWLIAQTSSENLDIKEALSRVRTARLQVSRSGADLYPALDSSAAAQKSERKEDGSASTDTESYTAGFDAGWELDIFGGVRRSVEAARRDMEAENENLHDVVVSLLAEVAVNYIDLRTYQQRLRFARSNVELQQQTWELLSAAASAGSGDELAVAQARYNLESSKARLPNLEAGVDAALNRLAVLTGKPPGSLHAKLGQAVSLPQPSLAVAVGVPADILRQRPDIRSSERELAAQTARLGVAEAELYPRFTLSGSIGLEAISLDKLISEPTSLWSFGPSIQWPIFDAGAIRNNIKIQDEQQRQAFISYRQTILVALEEVENALVAYATEQQRFQKLRQASSAAETAAELAGHQNKAGVISFSNVLDAQRSLLSFEDQMAESRGIILTNLVQLYKSLGGGWQSMTPATSINEHLDEGSQT